MEWWTAKHRELTLATAYQDYQDIQRNNESGMLANIGDNLHMDTPTPKLHDIVVHGQIMPTLAKS